MRVSVREGSPGAGSDEVQRAQPSSQELPLPPPKPHKQIISITPSLEAFQNRGDVALRDVANGHGGLGWAWGSERALPTLMTA